MHYGGHIERLIGTTMGAVHVLPGTTQSSPKDKGEYDSTGKAVMTLETGEERITDDAIQTWQPIWAKHSWNIRRQPLPAF
ncbi:MAG: hypothetical protein ABJU19_24160 [Roseobacter sp.]